MSSSRHRDIVIVRDPSGEDRDAERRQKHEYASGVIVQLLPLIVSLLALAVAIYGVTEPSADASAVREPDASISAARVFMLLRDGRVEISDGVGRRTFRWDGHEWVEAPPVQVRDGETR